MDKEELNKLVKELEDLQIRQEIVIKKIRASTEEATQSADRSVPSTEKKEAPFRTGQKVLIKNRLAHTYIGRTSIKDRLGTVTKITKKRVHLTTCNGSETSRAPHNLKLLTQQEYEQILKNA